MKKVWNEHLDNLLRRHYPKGDLDEVARRMGMTKGAIRCRAQVLGIKRKVHKREPWTDRQLAYLRKHYADMRAEDIALKVRHTIGSVWRTASKLGLKKSPEFLAQWGHLVASTEGARRNQFAKGHVSHNKGKSIEEFMSEEGIRNSSRTRFKAGHRPHNTRDVGTDCTHADGYVYCKLYNEVNTSVCIDSFSFVQREKSMFSCCVRFVLTRSAGTRYNTLALASCKKNKDKSIAL